MRVFCLASLLMLVSCSGTIVEPAWGPRVNVSPTPGEAGNLVGGRFASVVVHPSQPGIAWAAAEAGGLYVTKDGGQTWLGANRPDGSPGVGQGFAGTGVNMFSQLAVNDGGSLLLLAGTGNFFSWGSGITGGPVWRSNDGGDSWVPASNVTPAPPGPFGPDGQIVYSTPSKRGYAVIGNWLGTSTAGTDGDQWTWSQPSGNVNMNGLDLFPASAGKNPFADSSTDVLAFTTNDSVSRTLVLLNANTAQMLTYAGPPADAATIGGYCQVAFDPDNSFHVFLASAGNSVAQISEGIISADGTTITWIDLTQGKSSGTNGRPAFVQAHRSPQDPSFVSLYYHDTTNLWTMDCAVSSACVPKGWKQVATVHADISRVAFDPSTACPAYIADDGGLEVSSDCGATWTTPRSDLHALEPWSASFGQGYGSRSVFLDLQDNGRYMGTAKLSPIGPGVLAWTQSKCGDGRWSTINPTEPTRAFASCNGNTAEYDPVPDVASNPFTLPSPATGTPLRIQTAGDGGTIAAFVANGRIEVPMLDASNRLQMWSYDMTTNLAAAVGQPSASTFVATSLFCDFATAGGPGPDKASAYLVYNGLRRFDGTQWTTLTGPATPFRVWGDLSGNSDDAGRIVVLDSANSSIWRSTDGTTLNQDVNLTNAVIGLYGSTLPTDACRSHLCSVAWDPTDSQRMAVGTDHQGIFFSPDGGSTWNQIGVPEPNGGVTGLSIEPTAGGATNALAAIWGEGLWAIELQGIAMKIHTVKGNSIQGEAQDAERAPLADAPLHVLVFERERLEAYWRADARRQAQYDARRYYAAFNGPAHLPSLEREATPPSPLVFERRLDRATDRDGAFSVELPADLPTGRYYVQLVYPGDGRRPRATIGTPYDVGGVLR